MTDNTVGAWALTRLDAIRKLTREGYAVVNAEGYQRLRAQAFGEGVPVGGGEPQPTTSTDNEALCLDPHCLLDSDHKGECEQEPSDVRNGIEGDNDPGPEGKIVDLMAALEDSVAKAKAARQAVREAREPVRSAGGGDQPDTPCPECGGSGRVWRPGYDGIQPCPTCADKAQP